MSERRPATLSQVALGALTLVALVVLVIVIAGVAAPSYTINLELQNAAGLRDDSEVTVGGVKVGRVELDLADDDSVAAVLKFDQGARPIGRDATVAIASVNFLGQKRVEIVPGDASHPAASGYTIPAERITTATDIDQVLDVLDTDTRTRLAILLSEAGAAVEGRRTDVSTVLEELPPSVTQGTELLNQITGDNTTLARLVAQSDRFVAEATAERKALVNMIDKLGQASTTVVTQRENLGATLAQAPGTMATLRRFLGELEDATVPLGPAARDLSRTAPRLEDVLDELEPFEDAASPALRTASDVAPDLSKLGNEGTPVLRQAVPAIAELSKLGDEFPPIGNTLDRSADNLLAVVENWSRAIQFRDGLSHVFRGEASMSPEAVRSMVNRLDRANDPDGDVKDKLPEAASRKKDPKPAATQSEAEKKNPVKDLLDKATDKVREILDRVKGNVSELSKHAVQRLKSTVGDLQGRTKAAVTKLLDRARASRSAGDSAGGRGSDGGNNIGHLLNYLLGP